jgi:hypothetical protein
VVTSTDPPAPVPATVLAISAPVVILIWGADTTTDPAFPLAAEVAEKTIPLRDIRVTCGALPDPDRASPEEFADKLWSRIEEFACRGRQRSF